MQETKKQKGQVIIILLMLMLVALSIGLAVTQKSITDVTTSTQTEQSSRAFSAAEAGIEKALTGGATIGQSYSLGNDATATVDFSALLPLSASNPPPAIQYPPIGRETTAQFWMMDPKSPMASATYYQGNVFDLYFGNPKTTEKPAVELKVVMSDNGVFKTKVYYFDSTGRNPPNGFSIVPASCKANVSESVDSILGLGQTFFCKQTVGPVTIPGSGPPETACNSPACKLILVRARILYANDNQKIALAPNPPSGNNKFPPQVQIYNATGVAGQSQKQIQAFRVIDVVPAWFDFAIFSVNEIRK